ncbi:MAG: response regulator [Pseudomonadota bacterium]
MPKRVLVIDAIATHRICFAALLETARYQVETVATLDDPFRQPSDYDFVLVGLPKEQAGSFVSEVKAALEGSYAPILCLDRYPSMHRRLLVLRAGARDILPVDSPDELILAIVRRLIRQSEADHESQRRRITAASFGFSEAIAKDAKPARIACLGALGNVPSSLSTLLNHEFIQLHSLEDIQDAVGIQGVDGFLLDTGEERQALREILPELRDQTHLSPTPVMAVYPTGIPALATDALALGATEIVADVACI